MSNTKHTPGPWVCTYGKSVVDNFFISEQQDTTFSIAIIPNKYRPKALNEANAKLIAAAPELLDCLISIKKSLQCQQASYEKSHSEYMILQDDINDIEAAIKKATG